MNGKMPKEIRDIAAYFFVASLFVSFSSGLGLVDSFSRYRSEVSVMVLPQGSGTSLREAAENTVELSKTPAFRQSFFDSIATDMNDWSDLPGNSQADAYANLVAVSLPGDGSVFTVTGYAVDRDDAAIVSRAATDALVRFAGHYYNVKTDVGFRIIEGPKTTKEVVRPGWFILASVVLGFLITGLFFGALFLIPKLFSFGKRSFGERALFRPDVFEPKKPADTFQEITAPRETVLASMPDVPVQMETPKETAVPDHVSVIAPVAVPKAHAPINLPGSFSPEEEAFLREFTFVGEEGPTLNLPSIEGPEPIAEPIIAASSSEEVVEPDEEEYKRRLNQLLRGNL